MKLILLAIFFSFSVVAQSSESLKYFNDLPENVKQEFLDENFDLDSQKFIEIEDNLDIGKNNEDQPNVSFEEIKEPFFGYKFFLSNNDTKTPVLDVPLQGDYLLSFNDEVELLITGNKQDQYNLRIDLSGNVLIPEVGSVSLLNLTLSEANKKVSNLIQEYYLGSKAYLSVSAPSLKKISIIGAVQNPGTYLMNPFISLTESLKYAGGLTENSSLRNISVTSLKNENSVHDLYDFLIYGDRKNDINLRNGDTILVNATSDYVDITGEVLRPQRYEYLPSDTFSDLINFSQGYTNRANTSNISVNALVDGQLKTFSATESSQIDSMKIESFNVGSIVTLEKKDIFVEGDAVTNGFFKYTQGQKFTDFIKELSFSDDIYPFYFLVKQNLGNGMQKEFFNLSLADPSTYENIILGENVNIEFFSKSQILELNRLNDEAFAIENEYESKVLENPLTEELNLQEKLNLDDEEFEKWQKLKNTFPLDRQVSLNIANKNFLIPLAGRFTTKSIFEYMGLNVVIDKQNVSVSTRTKIELNSFETIFNSNQVLSITIPPNKDQTFQIKISGNISSPGTYIVPTKTTLNELYDIAGGLTDGASTEGIILTREQVKELERKALNGAKKIIMDSVISQQANASFSNNISSLDYSSIISLIDESEVSGRITGNFSPGSPASMQTILQNGDEIFIPSVISTVTVSGEVLNPITTGFKDDSTYEDYIEAAGGFTTFADKKAIYIIKSDGTSIRYSKGFMTKNQYPEPGDTIVVPRDFDEIKGLPLVSVATKIISDIAFAAASLNSLSD